MKRNRNAERQSDRVWEGGITFPSGRRVYGCPSPKIFCTFSLAMNVFWCIMSACSNVSIRRLKVKTVEKQFCVPVVQ